MSLKVASALNAYRIGLTIMFIAINISFHMPWLSNDIKQILFFVQCIIVGCCDNWMILLFDLRMNPLYIAVSLELAYCIGSIVASNVPIIAVMR